MTAATEEIQKSAVISECGTFRYLLERRWYEGRPLVFVMLNPSTADADKDDNTIRRCIGFAKRNGFPAIAVVNLFAYRATDPKDLKAAGFPVGPENDAHILAAAKLGGAVVCGYGVNASRTRRPAEVCKMLRDAGVELKCLKITDDGWPSHPLMLSYDLKLIPYSPV